MEQANAQTASHQAAVQAVPADGEQTHSVKEPGSEMHQVAAAAILLKNSLEQGLDGYSAHFKGAFGPFPAVKLYRTISGLSSDYTENLHNSDARSLAWIMKTGKSLSQALPECSAWWKSASKNPATKHEDLEAVAELMKTCAGAVKQARILTEKHGKPAAENTEEATEPLNSSVAALTAGAHHAHLL